VVLFAVLCGGWYVFAQSADPAQVAHDVVAECAHDAPTMAACYEQEVPNLYPKLSLPAVFDVVRDIRAEDKTYQFCHVLAHKLGERLVAEDPDKWLDLIPLNPRDGLCSNGFVHGVIGGRFRAEVLSDATLEKVLPDFSLACEAHSGWTPTSFDRANCYHSMGHLFVFITDADIDKAFSLCERAVPEDTRRMCVQGVFMQIYQPLEPDDFLLIEKMQDKPATTTVRQYCAGFSKNPLYQGSCLEESWPFFRTSVVDGTGVKAYCSGYPNKEEENYCYLGVSSIVGRMQLSNPDAAISACNNFPQERQATCFGFAAQAQIEESHSAGQKAVAICQLPRGPLQRRVLSNWQNTHSLFLARRPREVRFVRCCPMSTKKHVFKNNNNTGSSVFIAPGCGGERAQ
jgi:hypothetical protein